MDISNRNNVNVNSRRNTSFQVLHFSLTIINNDNNNVDDNSSNNNGTMLPLLVH